MWMAPRRCPRSTIASTMCPRPIRPSATSFWRTQHEPALRGTSAGPAVRRDGLARAAGGPVLCRCCRVQDRKSTRLNSSHLVISYAVFCLKKKKTPALPQTLTRSDVSDHQTDIHLHMTTTHLTHLHI